MNKNYSFVEVCADKNQKDVKILKVEFSKGISVEIMNFGGIIRSLEVPDQNGNKENIVLNYDSVNHYIKDKSFIGCLIGRYANRINKGHFRIGGAKYQLTCNNGIHHLHGGFNGFDKQVWKILGIEEFEHSVTIKLYHLSLEGDQGYPGNIEVIVKYTISENSLVIEYEAESDEDTIFNPTSHSYFNLSGDFQSTINNHWLQIKSSRILEVDANLIPNGHLNSVGGSVYDFSESKTIGSHGYDICYELAGGTILKHRESGRVMEIRTSLPGLQLYTADNIEGIFKKRSGVCLETQFYPDSPNHSNFPSTFLKKGKPFSAKTVHLFRTTELNK